jgi:hypothetical protein
MQPVCRRIAIGALALLASVSLACAQIRLVGASDADWTVLTITPNGAWGAATDGALNQAIAGAIARCRAITPEGGCGAYQISVQRQFAIALLCGRETILAAGATLDDARRGARKREQALRRDYHADMQGCRQVALVAPDGIATSTSDLTSSASNAAR